MKAIYKFDYDAGRHGSLSGIFVSEDSAVRDVLDKVVNFGEALGKHSEVEVRITNENLQLVSDSPEDVEVFERLELASGYNPVRYKAMYE